MTHAAELTRRFQSKTAIVGVIGLGYVGLPLSCTIAEAGLAVVGFDVDTEKIRRLTAGESYLHHVPASRLRAIRSPARSIATFVEAAGKGRFLATADFAELVRCDAILICVPTPLTEGREPDLSYVESTAQTIAARLRPGQIVVLESTTYPGTTDEIVRPILEGSGLRAGEDFHLSFSPEREDPGNERFSTRTTPKIVGGVTPACGAVGAALYESFVERVIRVSSARVAEASKLLENIYRSVNIALVNELKMLFERMGIDVWEVIDAAATKPFGFTPFYPGPGLGGHCIPIDPFYLTWKARHYDFATRFIELAGEINTTMPYWVVERVAEALGQRGKALPGASILVLGIAYKRDVDDLRESPALKVLEILESKGAKVSYNDPYVPSLRARRLRHYDTFELDSAPLDDRTLSAADCVLIATDHGAYDYPAIVAGRRYPERDAAGDDRAGEDRLGVGLHRNVNEHFTAA